MPTSLLKLSGQMEFSLIARIIIWLFMIVTVIAVLVPFSPNMPEPSLDPSWQFGMNQAVAQDLAFGTEMIFTYGPYAFIYTKLYHPSTYHVMLAGSLYLAFSYLACFFFVMNRVQWSWILITGIGLAGLLSVRDPLLFLYPLLAALTTDSIIVTKDRNLITNTFMPIFVALIFAPFGLLPLIKGSILIWCGTIAVTCSVYFLVNQRRSLAVWCLLSPLASLLFFWNAVGQPVEALPQYFISMAHIVSGYTEAMSTTGPMNEVILYLTGSLVVLIALATQKQITPIRRGFLLLTYTSFLFMSYKAGFIRHDEHAVIAGTALLLATLLLPSILPNKTMIPVMMIVIFAWFLIDRHYTDRSQGFSSHFLSTYATAWQGLQRKMENPAWPRSRFDATVRALRQQAGFPALPGATDIYSFNQTYLIASGNRWTPRPILQSYSAYTPTLAEINRQHLLGVRAPDNLIFRVEPIDGRMPSMEDGTSWPILMMKYRPTRLENEFLFLKQRESTNKVKEPSTLSTEHHAFGERVPVPESNHPIMARMEIVPTLLGRIVSLLFKPSPLYLTLELKDNISKRYRLISGMAESGFLLSPLIENTGEFSLLYGPKRLLDHKAVTSATVSPRDVGIKLWHEEYTVTFSRMPPMLPTDIFSIYTFDQFDERLSDVDVTPAESCDGNIDVINNSSPAHPQLSGSTLLTIHGWVAASVEDTVLPESVYVVLTDQRGQHHYLQTRQTSRPDVGMQFANPELIQSGFRTMADISALEGTYTIGLAMEVSNTIQLCPQFSIPITIAP